MWTEEQKILACGMEGEPSDVVTVDKLNRFINRVVREHMLPMKEQSKHNGEALARIETALFAKTGENEFESPGLVTVMAKIDKHVDVMCNLAQAVKKTVVVVAGGVVTLSAVYGALKTMGVL